MSPAMIPVPLALRFFRAALVFEAVLVHEPHIAIAPAAIRVPHDCEECPGPPLSGHTASRFRARSRDV
jgi:hypothetical protein